MAAKKQWYTQDNFSNLLIKILWYLGEFYFYCIFLDNENFKMEVEQTIFVTHYNIITVQLCYRLFKNPPAKIWSNKFQMVMIIIVSYVQVTSNRKI